MFSSLAQWSIRLPCGQAIRVQSAAEPFLFFFLFFGGRGGEGAGVGCSCFFFSLFSLFCFSFIPTAALYLIFTKFCDTRISRY